MFLQLRADKEQHAVFSVFDENKSWYLDENIRRCYDQSKVSKADPDFYKSNVMHSESYCYHNTVNSTGLDNSNDEKEIKSSSF